MTSYNILQRFTRPRLRHAYASLLGDAGPPDHDIQLRLGHAHPGEIRWYGHPYPDPRDGQATRDAIDAAFTAAEARPQAGSGVLTLLTEQLTSPELGSVHVLSGHRPWTGAPVGLRLTLDSRPPVGP